MVLLSSLLCRAFDRWLNSKSNQRRAVHSRGPCLLIPQVHSQTDNDPREAGKSQIATPPAVPGVI
jgi:hypothetical protein